MWVGAAFLSALLLGLYDVAKKRSLAGNAVVPVLLLNTLFSSLLLLPYILDAHLDLGLFGAKFLQEDYGYDNGLREHLLVALKASITLSSWLCGYHAIKHLPLTIVGPVNATRPASLPAKHPAQLQTRSARRTHNLTLKRSLKVHNPYGLCIFTFLFCGRIFNDSQV